MPYIISEENRIEGVEQKTTPNMGGKFTPKRRRFIIIHYTAGPSLEGTLRTFANPKKQVSAHLVIDRDGKIAQVVPFNRVAWHAGASSWKPAGSRKIVGLNNYSIGIELVNAGPLTFTPGSGYFTWWGAVVPPTEVVEVDPKAPESFHKKFWHRFPGEQISTLVDIAEALTSWYGLEDILGHSDVAPGRKTDPGPAFPMNNVRSALYGRV